VAVPASAMGLRGEQELPKDLGVPRRSQWLSSRRRKGHARTRDTRLQVAVRPGERAAKDLLNSMQKGGL